jgi:hypothetical protein
MPLCLGRERDHRGRASAGGRTRTSVEIVRHARRRWHRLVEVAVRINATRGDNTASGINLAGGASKLIRQGRNATIAHADFTALRIGSGHDDGIANYKVKSVTHHCCPAPVWNAPCTAADPLHRCRRPANRRPQAKSGLAKSI